MPSSSEKKRKKKQKKPGTDRLLSAAILAGALILLCTGYYLHRASHIFGLIESCPDTMTSFFSAPVSSEPEGVPGDTWNRLGRFDTGPRVRMGIRYKNDRLLKRTPVPLEEISPSLILAVVAAEDRHFFEHEGVSVTGIARAGIRNLLSMKIVEGGSTITQQVIKNVFLDPQRRWRRKISEGVLSLLAERRFSKDRILEVYLNTIYLGQEGPVSIMGVEEACRYYFHRSCRDVSLNQAASLAALISSPGRVRAEKGRSILLAKRNRILVTLGDMGFISTRIAEVEQKKELPFDAPSQSENPASYAVDALLMANPGLMEYESVCTTLDPRVQAAVEQAAGKLPEPLQCAIVVLDGNTSSVLGLVGGTDPVKAPYNRAVVMKRSVGSLVKPFIYLEALSRGWTLDTVIQDRPVVIPGKGRPDWSPRNHDGQYRGPITLTEALADSRNAATVRLARDLGWSSVDRCLRNWGFSYERFYPSMSLGSLEQSPLDLAGIYATLYRLGVSFPPQWWEWGISGGSRRFNQPSRPVRTFPKDTARVILPVLRQVSTHGTARAWTARGKRAIACKTGTSDGMRDAWLAVCSPLVTVIWVGHDDGSSIRQSGSQLALPVFMDFYEALPPSYRDRFHVIPD